MIVVYFRWTGSLAQIKTDFGETRSYFMMEMFSGFPSDVLELLWLNSQIFLKATCNCCVLQLKVNSISGDLDPREEEVVRSRARLGIRAGGRQRNLVGSKLGNEKVFK